MSSQGGSRASHSALPEKEREQKITATSGRKCSEQFKRFNRYGSWAKTFLDLLIGQGDWYSSKCRLTWKMKGTKSHRIYFQLVAKTHPTKGIEFGLLPTPRVSETEGAPVTNVEMKNGSFSRTNKKGERWGVKLKDVIASGLLPTPEANNFKNGHKTISHRIERKMEQGWTIGLNDRATLGLLPTPTNSMVTYQDFVQAKYHSSKRPDYGKIMLPTPSTRDTKGANGTGRKHLDQLPNALKFQHGITGQLNPLFVAEMMGFPMNWTVLPFLNGETKALKPTGTQ